MRRLLVPTTAAACAAAFSLAMADYAIFSRIKRAIANAFDAKFAVVA